VMEQIAEINRRADLIYIDAANDNPALALKALKEIREVVSLYAKVTGEIQAKTINNIIITPEWTSIRAVMLRALEPYPEARRALVVALGGFDIVEG